MSDASIIFDTGLNNAKLEKQLQDTKKKIEGIENDLNTKKNVQSGLETELEDAKKAALETETAIKSLKAELSALNELTGVNGPNLNPDEYARAIDRQKVVTSELKAQEATLERQDKDVERIMTKYTRCTDQVTELTDRLGVQKEKAGEIVQQIEALNASVDHTPLALRRAEKYMDRFTTRVKALARRAFVFTIIASALRQMRVWFGKTVKTNDQATAAVARLKGALLTLAQPLVGVLIPAFTAFVNILTAVVSALANIVSMIFGTTAQASADAAESLYNETHALEGVGGAAKKAGKSLASFDEINKLSGDTGSSGSGGGGYSEIQPDFSEFQPDLYKKKLDEITTYVSGALLALGAILFFTNANPPLGLGLMAIGAVGLAATITANWGAMDAGLRTALSTVLITLGTFAFVIGAVLALSGANIPLGIGLMLAGAALLGGAVALNWELLGDQLNETLGALLIIIGGFLAVIGVILMLTGHVPSGLGLLIAGIAIFAAGAIATNWDTMKGQVSDFLGTLFVIIGGFLAVVGIILLITGNLPLGFGLLIAGAAAFSAGAAALRGDIIANEVNEMLGALLICAGGAMLAVGLILMLTGAGAPLGLGLMIAGGATLGVGVAALNWGWILDKLQGIWSDIKNWWNTGAAKYFTADYWTDLGKHMLDGLFKGLSKIGSKIGEWGSDFIDGVEDFFGIHSPSTEFETLGKYMMLGMEGGIDDNNEVVLAVFSGLLARMLAATQTTTSDMQADFALFLLYLMGEFSRGWDGSWQNFSAVASRNIQSVMTKIDALNAKLASIERNITIAITTVNKTVGGTSGDSRSGRVSSSGASVASRIAAMPTKMAPVPMATGGVIPPNREFLALYGDQRHGNNIEAPEGLIRKIVREESGGMNAKLLQAILDAIKAGAVVMIDRDQVGRVIYDTYNSESSRHGVKLTTR